MADVLSVLVQHIAKTGIGPVMVDLPHNFEIHSLPTVDVHQVGPSNRRPGLNGLGADFVDIDCDVYVTPTQWESGEAMILAQRLRFHLARLNTAGVRAIDVSRPAQRLDRNPSIRRVGLTVTLGTPA